MDIHSILFDDADYPKLLRALRRPPKELYYSGDLSVLNQFCVAIIGKRDVSAEQYNAARQAGEILGKLGYVVINGLAIGCDQAAVEGVLSSGGKIIAVMPCGIDEIYPKSAQKYVGSIISNGGCIVSEYPCGVRPQKYMFVERDRIQAALARKVFVVAAEEKSGTMHTVDYALKFGRSIGCYNGFSSPGNDFLIRKNRAECIDDMEGLIGFVKGLSFEQISLFD